MCQWQMSQGVYLLELFSQRQSLTITFSNFSSYTFASKAFAIQTFASRFCILLILGLLLSCFWICTPFSPDFAEWQSHPPVERTKGRRPPDKPEREILHQDPWQGGTLIGRRLPAKDRRWQLHLQPSVDCHRGGAFRGKRHTQHFM